jgi:hypothetical protein
MMDVTRLEPCGEYNTAETTFKQVQRHRNRLDERAFSSKFQVGYALVLTMVIDFLKQEYHPVRQIPKYIQAITP